MQQLWLAGKREQAAEKVPDEMVTRTSLLGTEEMVKERMRAYKKAGISTLRLDPEGGSVQQRLTNLGRAMDLLNAVNQE